MTRDDRAEFDRLTTRPELRDLRPDAKQDMGRVVFLALVLACVEIMTGGILALFLDWRWAVIGGITMFVTLVLGVAIEGFRTRKH